MSGGDTARPRYAELQVTSHFSFLRGASSCEELFAQAADLGIEALAITDRNSIAGVIRAYGPGTDKDQPEIILTGALAAMLKLTMPETAAIATSGHDLFLSSV